MRGMKPRLAGWLAAPLSALVLLPAFAALAVPCPPFVAPYQPSYVPPGWEDCQKCAAAPAQGLVPLHILFCDGTELFRLGDQSEVDVCITGPAGHSVWLVVDLASGPLCVPLSDEDRTHFLGIPLEVSAYAMTIASGVLDSTGQFRARVNLGPFIRPDRAVCLQAASAVRIDGASFADGQASNVISALAAP